jgi:hypothetical protein
MGAGILLGLPALFVAWRAVPVAAARPSAVAVSVDLAPLADQLRLAIGRQAIGRPADAAGGRANLAYWTREASIRPET